MTADQKLGIILGITTGINLLVFGSAFIYYSISLIKELKKGNKYTR